MIKKRNKIVKSKRKLISPIAKTIDKRITVPTGDGVRASFLYSNPRLFPFKYRPITYVTQDLKKSQTPGVRISQIQFARSLYGSMPELGNAIEAKNSWAFSEGWLPKYNGQNKDWGTYVENWLKTRWYQNCNLDGANMGFHDTLYATGKSIDLDGDSGCVFNITKTGWPLVQLIASHRIGSRYNDNIIHGGEYDGLTVIDGVILDENNERIAYNIKADLEKDDVILPAGKFQLLYETEWSGQYRGISRVARTVTDWLDMNDIDEAIKRGVKLASTFGIKHKRVGGIPDPGAPIIGAQEDPLIEEMGVPKQYTFNLENAYDAGNIYLDVTEGEDIEPFYDERPSPNTEGFIERVRRRAIGAVGWYYELLNPQTNSSGNRSIINQARNTIRKRQLSVMKRARLMVQFAVSTAMQNKIIPPNYADKDEWWNWSFTRPKLLTIDGAQEEAADRENVKIGSMTLSEVVAKRGEWWKDVRDQTQEETEDLIQRALNITKKFPKLSFDKALSLLSQRTPNESPAAQKESELIDIGGSSTEEEKTKE
jgi:hypothetical protein